ncbi:hypothetical protein [Oceanobacillus jeddahense]|uniref:Transporter n=1 Tax=Oceanobacillus jeddahense TaxID=1462527 RepID=A0ABY5JN43_9BACI|nr:hypothetical protein [Oceanobacillus jeddahense]UUI01709.1 hypothetical protein NP439_16860 [Oceanobacillus jeddahense]
MSLTIPHVLYGFFTLLILMTMVFRRGIVLPSLLGTFVIACFYNGSIVSGFMAIFNANLVAARELFSIFLIITFMLALLNALKDLKADVLMIQPIQRVMVNGHLSYFVLIIVTYFISLFFWPTPAVPLICALLVPAAIRSGLPAITAAVAITIAGQGMALSSDYIVQVAPALSAAAAGVETTVVADRSFVLSVITGVTATLLAYLFYRKSIRSKDDSRNQEEIAQIQDYDSSGHKAASKNIKKWSRMFAWLVPIVLLLVVGYMLYSKFFGTSDLVGGEGAALVGGVAVILLLLATSVFGKQNALDYVGNHITNGFVFAFKAMGPVIPIAGFFFLGNAEFSREILLVEEAPSFLFDIISSIQAFLPESTVFVAFTLLIVGIITGLDGSGFSGLPLTGALAASLESASMDASTLAAIGQLGAIWTGGGALIAWSSLIAVAGFCGVSAIELVRKNFFPVILGLFIATIAAVIIF